MLISEAIVDVRTGLESEVQDGLEMFFFFNPLMHPPYSSPRVTVGSVFRSIHVFG